MKAIRERARAQVSWVGVVVEDTFLNPRSLEVRIGKL